MSLALPLVWENNRPVSAKQRRLCNDVYRAYDYDKFDRILPWFFGHSQPERGFLPPHVILLSDLQSTWNLVRQKVWLKTTQTQKMLSYF